MEANKTARYRRMSLISAAAFWVAGLLIAGLIGWLWFVSADNSAWKAVSLAAVLALAPIVVITWCLSRVRAERRWRAALDAYAEKELATRTYNGATIHE
jgi:MFS family permease